MKAPGLGPHLFENDDVSDPANGRPGPAPCFTATSAVGRTNLLCRFGLACRYPLAFPPASVRRTDTPHHSAIVRRGQPGQAEG